MQEGSKNMDRRGFLKSAFAASAVVGASVALVGCSNETSETKEPSASATDGASGYTWDDTADVLVVGAGSGMMAAIEAYAAGASKVIVLEKEAEVGGDTKLSGGVIYVAGSSIQAEQGIVDERTGKPDTQEAAVEDWMAAGYGKCDRELVANIESLGQYYIDWFSDRGVDDWYLYQSGVHPVKRGHANAATPDEAGGHIYTDIMLKEIEDAEGMTLYTETKALELLRDSTDRVIGVKAHDKTGKAKYFGAKTVILSAGGVGCNKKLTMTYNPETIKWENFGGNFATGDWVPMGESVNARFVGFRNRYDPSAPSAVSFSVSTYPAKITSQTHVVFGDSPKAVVFVGADGKRIFDEAAGLKPNYLKVAESPAGFCWCVFDQTFYDDPQNTLYVAPNGSKEALATAVKEGIVLKADSLEELAKASGVAPDTLLQTIAAYNGYAAAGSDPDCGRAAETMVALTTAPYYAHKLTPASTTPSLGASISLDIDLECRVLDNDGVVIPGLYATGVGVVSIATLGYGYVGSGGALISGFAMGNIAGKAAAAEAASLAS